MNKKLRVIDSGPPGIQLWTYNGYYAAMARKLLESRVRCVSVSLRHKNAQWDQRGTHEVKWCGNNYHCKRKNDSMGRWDLWIYICRVFQFTQYTEKGDIDRELMYCRLKHVFMRLRGWLLHWSKFIIILITSAYTESRSAMVVRHSQCRVPVIFRYGRQRREHTTRAL